MLIIWDNLVINTANVTTIAVDEQNVTYDIAGKSQLVQTYDTEAKARKIFNRIVDALIDDARVCDLRRSPYD